MKIGRRVGALGVLIASLTLLGACGSQEGRSVSASDGSHDHDHSHDHGSSNICNNDSCRMQATSPDDADVIVEIEFRNGVVYTLKNRVSISSGDQVVFSIISDVDEVIHVHGVDLIGEVLSGDPTNYLGIRVDSSGIFKVEFENSGTFIVELLVS